MSNSSYFRRFGACVTVLTALGLASCKSDSGSSSDVVAQTVTVVAEDSPQSQLLTEIYAQALEHSGFRVARRDNVADLAAGYTSLKSGAADLFITHTGELLKYVTENEPAAASTSTTAAPTTTEAPTTSEAATTTSSKSTTTTSKATTTTSKSTATTNAGATTTSAAADETSTTIGADETTTTTISTTGQAAAESINGQTNLIGEVLPDSLQIGAASDAEDKSVIACNNAVSTTGYLTNLTQLARDAPDLSIAGPADFETATPFGLPGFENVYGATFGKFIATDATKIGDSITSPTTVPDTSVSTTIDATSTTAVDATTTTVAALPSEADCGAFNSLDPSMPADAVEMDDDQNWIETNGVIPLMSATAYTPGVSQLVDQVSQTLKTVDLRAMIARVVNDNVTPAAMASQYITAAGLAGS